MASNKAVIGRVQKNRIRAKKKQVTVSIKALKAAGMSPADIQIIKEYADIKDWYGSQTRTKKDRLDSLQANPMYAEAIQKAKDVLVAAGKTSAIEFDDYLVIVKGRTSKSHTQAENIFIENLAANKHLAPIMKKHNINLKEMLKAALNQVAEYTDWLEVQDLREKALRKKQFQVQALKEKLLREFFADLSSKVRSMWGKVQGLINTVFRTKVPIDEMFKSALVEAKTQAEAQGISPKFKVVLTTGNEFYGLDESVKDATEDYGIKFSEGGKLVPIQGLYE